MIRLALYDLYAFYFACLFLPVQQLRVSVPPRRDQWKHGVNNLDTPVVLVVFNRPEQTTRVFAAVASARPSRLFLVADGPRANHPGEAERCEMVKQIVSAVDWPCQVETNFAVENMGCGQRVISGLNWVFSLVEEAIILEDDCLPDPSFFPFCRELLHRYRGDSRIAAITGTNLVERYVKTPCSYYFSQIGGVWGWATWSSQWKSYDESLKMWPSLRGANALAEIFDRPRDIAYWTRVFDTMYDGRGPDTWDYQWAYTNLFSNRLTIVPRVNLVANIGFGEGATHTSTADSRLLPKLKSIEFPLRHPDALIASRSLDRQHLKLHFEPFTRRVVTKLKSIGSRASLASSTHAEMFGSHQGRRLIE